MEQQANLPLARMVGAGVALGVALRAAAFGWRVARAQRWAAHARPYERALAHATRRVLIVGDSTAVGLGSVNAAESVAGRLAAEFPHAAIVNRARLGARAADVLAQLHASPGRYDAVLIAVGGNDVIRGTPLAALAASLRAVIALARTRADRVLVANSANVGAAPLFFWPLRVVLSRRSLAVRRVFARVCREQRVRFVNFTWPPRRDPFRRDRGRYFAADGLHPTAAAYAHCYAVLRRRGLARALAA